MEDMGSTTVKMPRSMMDRIGRIAQVKGITKQDAYNEAIGRYVNEEVKTPEYQAKLRELLEDVAAEPEVGVDDQP